MKSIIGFVRHDNKFNYLSPISVFINGQLRAEVALGKEWNELSNSGRHEIHVAMGEYRSLRLPFHIKENERVLFCFTQPKPGIRTIFSLMSKHDFFKVIELRREHVSDETLQSILASMKNSTHR